MTFTLFRFDTSLLEPVATFNTADKYEAEKRMLENVLEIFERELNEEDRNGNAEFMGGLYDYLDDNFERDIAEDFREPGSFLKAMERQWRDHRHSGYRYVLVENGMFPKKVVQIIGGIDKGYYSPLEY